MSDARMPSLRDKIREQAEVEQAESKSKVEKKSAEKLSEKKKK